MAGSAGFSRLVAIKRLHRELAADRGLVAMLVDEARMASRIRHANVIDTLDLVAYDGAFSLVLEYVEGDSLSSLIKRATDLGEDVPRSIALAIICGVLRGLDAAHEARSDDGAPLGIVHRDVSPQNVLVGVDGVPRVIDFGVAKALGRLGSTRPGEVRGKYTYMAPEQLMSRPVTRQADVYSAGVVLWELLAHRRLFTGDDWRTIINDVMKGNVPNPSDADPNVPPELDEITKKAIARDLGMRYLTAREFLDELKPFPRASDDEVGAWVRRLAAEELAKRQRLVQEHATATDGQSVEDLMRDLKRSRSGAVPVLEPELLTSRTDVVAPLTAAFALPSQLEPGTTLMSVSPATTSGAMEIEPPVLPKRRGVAVVAIGIIASLVVLTLVGLGRRSADEAPKAVEASRLAATTLPPTTVVPPSPVTSADDPPLEIGAAPAVSAPDIATRPVRAESPGRRQKKAAPAATAYDPGNFR
jgi:serine/threonine-protein kinase